MRRFAHWLLHALRLAPVAASPMWKIVEGHRCLVAVYACCDDQFLLAHHERDCAECETGISRVLLDGALR